MSLNRCWKPFEFADSGRRIESSRKIFSIVRPFSFSWSSQLVSRAGWDDRPHKRRGKTGFGSFIRSGAADSISLSRSPSSAWSAPGSRIAAIGVGYAKNFLWVVSFAVFRRNVRRILELISEVAKSFRFPSGCLEYFRRRSFAHVMLFLVPYLIPLRFCFWTVCWICAGLVFAMLTLVFFKWRDGSALAQFWIFNFEFESISNVRIFNVSKLNHQIHSNSEFKLKII